MYLPVTDEDASIEEELEYHHPVVGSGHILVVDDHDVIRDVAAEMLESLGYDVHTVADGLEALDYFADKEHDIDLILMDLMMPRIDGRECLRRIRKRNPDVRVVLSTGYGRNNQAQEVLDEGSIGFIQKPYEIHSLSRAVASAMQGS